MTTLLLLFVAATLLQTPPSAARSAKKTAQLPDAKTILERAAAASGTAEARKAIQTEKLSGKMVVADAGIAGTIVIYRSQRGQSYQVLEIPGAGKTEIANNGDVEWERSTLTGPKVRRVAQTPGGLLEPDPMAALAVTDAYAKMETAGLDQADGRPCILVHQWPKANGPRQTTCFDRETYLPVKFQLQAGTRMLTMILGDYRTVGDVKRPFLIETETMGQKVRVEVDTITLNDPLPTEASELPEEIETLAYHQSTEVRETEVDKDRPTLRRKSALPATKK